MKKRTVGAWFIYLFLSIFILVGCGCLLYAPVKLIKTTRFIRRAETTIGTVVDSHRRSDRSSSYSPEVVFRARDGMTYRFRSRSSSGSADYSKGKHVQVYYDPGNPNQAEIKAFTALWMPFVILSVIGFTFTVSGLLLIAARRSAEIALQEDSAYQYGHMDGKAAHAWRSGAVPTKTRWEMSRDGGAEAIHAEQLLTDGAVPATATPVHRDSPFRIRLFMFMAICVIGWFAWPRSIPVPKKTTAVQTGQYINDTYKFAMKVPDGWKVLTIDEAIQCAEIRNNYRDQYLLMITPTTPDDCLLVVDIAGFPDFFRTVGWDGVVAEIGSRNPVKFTQVKEINGFTVHRVGYEVAGAYREDAYFEAGGKLIELYFYVPINTKNADRVLQMRALVDANLRKL